MLGGFNPTAGPPGLLSNNYLFMVDMWAFTVATGITLYLKFYTSFIFLCC